MPHQYHRVVFQTSGGKLWSHTKKHIDGAGMGSVLLRKDGPGAASSYYEPSVGSGIAKSLMTVNDKLEKLAIKKPKSKAINFNL